MLAALSLDVGVLGGVEGQGAELGLVVGADEGGGGVQGGQEAEVA